MQVFNFYEFSENHIKVISQNVRSTISKLYSKELQYFGIFAKF